MTNDGLYTGLANGGKVIAKEKFSPYYGIGAAIGIKITNRKHFVVEVYAGLGRQMLTET